MGCSKISPECDNCYAASAAASPRLQQFPQYQSVAEWSGKTVFVETQLLKPLEWKQPQRIFVCSMSDLFHESVKDEWRDQVFAVMAIARHHTFQILTKRPWRMYKYLIGAKGRIEAQVQHLLNEIAISAEPDTDGILRDSIQQYIENNLSFRSRTQIIEDFQLWETADDLPWPLPNVWAGTTVGVQRVASRRLDALTKCPAVIRFVSCEPLLESIDIEEWLYEHPKRIYSGAIDWVILGGESGGGARPCAIEWMQSLANQCHRSQTKVFVKQLGCNPVFQSAGKKPSFTKFPKSDRTGLDVSDYPPALRLREFPN